MADNYGNFLKRRALAFLDIAKINCEKGYYDLVLFHVEQFLQLYLKYLLFRKIGDYPRTHSLIRLIKDVIKVYKEESVEKLLQENMETLYLLEEAYITSRYLPRQYDKEIAERMLKFAEKALGVLKCLEKH
ncbi:MAG: HEPN domain-containing protein [Thermoproteales archaeon]|nr:HEPN domain-containing protein [Thermoproteales archaeon]